MIEYIPSPNFGMRYDNAAVNHLILHYTGMVTAQAAIERLCDRNSQVSSHYLIDEDGHVIQMVDEDKRAWHAGVSSWQEITDINSHSIGIELVNPGHELGYCDFPQKQIEALIFLSVEILARHAIPPRNILGHSDIAPLRKRDPGEKFPWELLAHKGIGHYAHPGSIQKGDVIHERSDAGEITTFQRKLRSYGYGLPVSGKYCQLTRACVRAFQRHFRPEKIDGDGDISTLATLEELLKK